MNNYLYKYSKEYDASHALISYTNSTDETKSIIYDTIYFPYGKKIPNYIYNILISNNEKELECISNDIFNYYSELALELDLDSDELFNVR